MPNGWADPTRHLRGRGFTDSELIAAGLSREGNRGTRDRFRARLMWPIRDLSGDVIAFGARKLDPEDDGPKYLNTPETSLFRKSTVLYGADLAKREIAQRRQAVIVEGYTDVMACHLAGVPTAVATCGTSFGEGHIKIVRRLLIDADWQKGEVIFTFDGDTAGRRAALRAFSLEERFVTQTFVAVQPDGLDPCDLRLKQGDAAIRDLVASRLPLYEFAVRAALSDFDLESAEGRISALNAAARIVARIKDHALRKVYAGKVDRWLGLMDEDLVLKRIGEHIPRRRGRDRPGGPGPGPDPGHRPGQAGSGDSGRRDQEGQPVPGAGRAGPAGYDPADPVVNLERQALKLAIQRPALLGPAFDGMGSDVFTAPAHRSVRELIAACGGVATAGPVREWVERLLGAAPNDNARMFLTRLAVESVEAPGADGEPDARFADDVLTRIEELAVSRQIVAVKARLQRMNPVTEQTGYKRMFGDLVALEQRRKLLSERTDGSLSAP